MKTNKKIVIKIKLYILSFIIFPLTLFAQEKGVDVYGRVLSKKRTPVSKAIVYLEKSRTTAITDNDGKFRLKCPHGKQTIFVSALGIQKTRTFMVDTLKKQILLPDILLDNQPISNHMLDEVVITGQYQPKGIRNSMYRTIILNNKYIEKKQSMDVESILNTNIGLYFPHDMAMGTSNIQIMGMGGNNVKILLDDMPLLDRNGRKQSLSDIDVNTIERIEIVYGPMSVIYGSDALAGVINIITKKRIKPGLSLDLYLTEETVGNEYHFLRNQGSHKKGLLFNYGFKNGFFLNGSISKRDFGGWLNGRKGRKREWFPKESNIFQLGAGYFKKNIDIKFKQIYSKNIIYNLSDITPGNMTAETKKYIVDRSNSQLAEKYQLSEKVNFKLDLSYQNYNRRTETYIYDLKNNTKETSTGEGEQDKMYFTTFFARLISSIKPTNKLEILHGLETSQETGSGDRIQSNSEIHYSDFIFSAEYTPVSNLNLSAGFRKSIVSTYKSPMWIPSINVKFSPLSWIDLRLSYAKGFRAPKLDELYMSFHDSNHNIDGNKNLKPEKSNTVSAAASFYPNIGKNLSLSSTLSTTLSTYKNYIDLFEKEDSKNYYTFGNLKREQILVFGIENKVKWRSLTASLNLGFTGRITPNFYDLKKKYPHLKKFKFNMELSSDISYDISPKNNISLFYKYSGAKDFYSIDKNKNIFSQKRKAFHYGDISFSHVVCKNLKSTIALKNIFNIKEIKSNMESLSGNYHGNGSNASIGYGTHLSVGLKYSW